MNPKKKRVLIIGITLGVILDVAFTIGVYEKSTLPKRDDEFIVDGNRYKVNSDNASIFDGGTVSFIGSANSKVIIPNTVTIKKYGLFPDKFKVNVAEISECDNKEVYIPKSVTIINYMKYPSYNNVKLKYISVSPDNKYYDSREDCGCLIRKENNEVILASNNSFIPDSVISIGQKCLADYFYGDKLSYTIPSNISYLHGYSLGAFYEGDKLDDYPVNYIDFSNVSYISSYCIYKSKLLDNSTIILPAKVGLQPLYSLVTASSPSVVNVFYKGIYGDSYNDYNQLKISDSTTVNFYYYKETAPSTNDKKLGKYWHYDSNNEMVIWE